MMVGPAELGLSLIAGGLTTLSPCVLPLLPLVLGGSVQSGRWAPLAIGAGMVTTFTVAGIALGLVGDSIGSDVDVVRYTGAWVLMAWALVMLVPAFERRVTGWLSPVAGSANQLAGRLDGGSLRGAFGLGALLGLVWSPCSGPLLASALTMVASEGGAARGGLILGVFGVGAAIPLTLAAHLSRTGFSKFQNRLLPYVGAFKRVFAVVLVAMSILILTGGDKWLEARVNEWLPDAWLQLTTLF